MRYFSVNPIEMISCLWRNRDLVSASVKREILSRYRGSVLGIFWSVFHPLMMLIVYTFVFSEVFKARWDVPTGSKVDFALLMFIGLTVFNLFSECINNAPRLIVSCPNYVKKVVFPLEIFPFVLLLSSLYHASINLGVWLLAYVITHGLPYFSIFYTPLILFPFCLFVLGLSWALASLGVFLRDIHQFIGVVTTVLMFLSPIFYPATALPKTYQQLIYINPLAVVIEQARDVLFWGKTPDFFMVGIYWVVSLATAWIGFAWFQKTRKGFADVL